MKYKIHQLTHENGNLIKSVPSKVHTSQNSTAIVVHLFYIDIWEEILCYLRELTVSYDLYVTIPENLAKKDILKLFRDMPNINLYMVENRGRDVLPFLQIFHLIGTHNYQYLCKLHTKKSVTSDSGNAWRKLLYYDLIGSPQTVENILETFEKNPDIGILTGKNLILNAIKFDLGNSDNVKILAEQSHIPYIANYHFAAGTMFWIRTTLLNPLLPLLECDQLVFENESGQSDHTLAHALERFFGLLCEHAQLRLIQSSADYRNLDKATLEELAILAFTQRFKYDLLVHSKNLLIHEKDDMLHEILSSKSYRYTKPFRHFEFLVKTLIHFKLEKINSHGTDEHKLAMGIKRRIPERVFLFIKSMIKKKTRVKQENTFWNQPLTSVSNNRGQRIVIVAELSIPQCKKYRVDQKVEMFEVLGYEADVISWTEYHKARNLLQLASLVFFYRVPAEDIVLQLVEECHRLNLKTIFDVDDLIFDEALLKSNINIQNLPKKVQSQVFSGAKTYKKAMLAMDYCSASTPVLAQYMSKHSEHESFIIPNALDNKLLLLSQQDKPLKDDENITIVYGSGTSTHDVDFQEVAPALFTILSKYPQIQLVIHGTLTLPENFKTLKAQIKEIPFMEASEYYQALNGYDINIAPLEESIFNDAKSNIKYLEASIFKLPTIASSVSEYKTAITHGKNGYLASNKEGWMDAFEKLIAKKSLRDKIGINAYNTVIENYTVEYIAKQNLLPLVETFIPTPSKNTKHIMMVNVLFSPTSFGGATIVVEELAKRINEKKNFDVTIVTAFFDIDKKLYADYDIVRYEAHGLPVILIRLPEPMLSKLEYHNNHMQDVLTDILKSTKPDLVHFHAIQQLSASITKSCLSLDIPYIITLHDMWWVCEKQFMIMPNGKYCHQTKIDTSFCQANCNPKSDTFTLQRTAYLKEILNHANLLLAPSKFQKELYAYNIDHTEKLAVNRNGILFPSKNYTKKRNERVKFAYVGGNANHKGYQFLKNIFECLTQNDYELVIIDINRKLGHNSMFESDWNIQGTLTIADGYENTQEGLDAFYSDIDVLLFPSQCKESFGLTVREVMVRDVWVISTDAGGVTEEIIEGENGNIVAMNDNQMFQDKIVHFIEHFSSFKHYSNPHKKNIRSYDTQADELIEYYNTILDVSCST